MKKSAREEVRKYREFMREALGANWAKRVRQMYDRQEPDWETVELAVHDKEGELITRFVVLARGGFDGEAIYEDEWDD